MSENEEVTYLERLQANNEILDNIEDVTTVLPTSIEAQEQKINDLENMIKEKAGYVKNPIYATGDLFTLNFNSILSTGKSIYSAFGFENYMAILRYNSSNWEYYDLFFFKIENGQLINLTPSPVRSIYYYYVSNRFGILYACDDFIDYVYGADRYSNPVYRLNLSTMEQTSLGNWNNYSYPYTDRYTIMRGMGDNKSTVSVSRYNPDTHSFVGGFSISYAYGSGYFAPDVFEFNDDAKTKAFRTIDTENDTVTYTSYGIKNIIGMNFAKTKVFKSDGVYEYLGNGVVGNKLADLNIASQISGNICCRNDKYYTASYNTSSSSGKYRFFTFDEETNMFELVMEVPCYSTSSSETSVVGGTTNSVVFRNGTIIACEKGDKEIGFTFKGKVYLYEDNAPSAINSDKVLAGYYVYDKMLDMTVGTMPNRGALNYTPSTSAQSIPEGYTSGGTISAVDNTIDSNIQAENIKKDVEILGVTGNYEGSTGIDTSNTDLTVEDLAKKAEAYSCFTNLYPMSNITDMSNAFVNTTNLVTLTSIDTTNITNMSNMFNGCSNLASISPFDMSNVTNAEGMFTGCTELTSEALKNIANILPLASNLTNTTLENLGLASNMFEDRSLRILVNLGYTDAQPVFNPSPNYIITINT